MDRAAKRMAARMVEKVENVLAAMSVESVMVTGSGGR